MPKRALPALILVVLLTLISCGSPEPPAETEPAVEREPGAVRLVLVLVVDQCAAEYIDRFASLFSGGLRMLIRNGALFTEAHHFHAVTATAVGHATLATGCFPGRHGIVANTWYERDTGERIYAVDDDEFDVSPRRMLVPALGDWLKSVDPDSKVFAASGKDRAAITMGGHQADGAFWYQRKTGAYISSEYYYPDGEPAWVDEFNDRRYLDQHFHEAWQPLPVTEEQLAAAEIEDTDFGPLHTGFPHVFGLTSPAPERWFYTDSAASPWNDELLMRFGIRLIEEEGLGLDGSTDILCLSFSALDWVGHDYGPNSREVLDTLLRLDAYLSTLIARVTSIVGKDHMLIAFTGDHGVAPVPEYRQTRGEDWTRISAGDVLCFHQADRLMDERFGEQTWFLPGPFLNPAAVDASAVPREELEQAVAAILGDCQSVERIWTRTDLLGGSFPENPAFPFYRNNFHDGRSPDFMIQFQPTCNCSRWNATTHGSPHRHDTHVPLILHGPGIPPGRVHDRVNTVDLAPTLAELAGIPAPAEIDGRSLVPDLEDVRVVLDEEDLAAAEPVAVESGRP